MMLLYFLMKLIFLVVLMTSLTQFKYTIKITYIIIISVNIILWLVSCIVYIYKGASFLDYIFPLAISLPEFICFLLISKLNPAKVLFSFLTVCNFGMLKSYVGIVSLNYIDSFWISLIFEALCFFALMLLIIKVLRKPYFKILNILEKGWGILCIVPFLLSIIIYILLYYTNSNNNLLNNKIIVFLVFTLMFVFYAIIYFNFENISEYSNMKLNREIVLIQTEMQKKNLRQYKIKFAIYNFTDTI